MSEQVFFYGTLRTGFNRTTRAGVDAFLKFAGRGWINGKLFDLGIYPAAVPATDARVWGEVFEITDPPTVLAALDRIEGHRPAEPERSLYNRVRVVRHAGRRPHRRCVGVFLQRAARTRAADYLRRLRRTSESHGKSSPQASRRPALIASMNSTMASWMRSDGSMNSMPDSIVHDFLVHVADAAVRDAALQDDRLVAECQPDVVQRIQVQRKRRFDQAAAVADLLDRERLEDHDLAVQLAEDLDPVAIALFVRVRLTLGG